MNTNYRKTTYPFILSTLAATAVVFAFSPPVSAADPKPDAELLRLEAALDAAGPQSELNIASQNISEYWDKKLAEVEKKVTRKLTAGEQVQFEASKKRFIAYREQEVEFRTSFYGRGTIRPLMASGEYSSITAHRVQEMESLLEGALEPRVDNP